LADEREDEQEVEVESDRELEGGGGVGDRLKMTFSYVLGPPNSRGMSYVESSSTLADCEVLAGATTFSYEEGCRSMSTYCSVLWMRKRGLTDRPVEAPWGEPVRAK